MNGFLFSLSNDNPVSRVCQIDFANSIKARSASPVHFRDIPKGKTLKISPEVVFHLNGFLFQSGDRIVRWNATVRRSGAMPSRAGGRSRSTFLNHPLPIFRLTAKSLGHRIPPATTFPKTLYLNCSMSALSSSLAISSSVTMPTHRL